MSYSHEEFVIDLTQVTATSGPNSKVCGRFRSAGPHARRSWLVVRVRRSSVAAADTFCLAQPEILHELELELARPEYLLATAAKRGDPNASELERGAFDELIRAFVNNARILVRNADGGWQ